jgi:hypothetical protein
VKITKISPDVLDAPQRQASLTPRQLARLELERSLEKAATEVQGDKSTAFRVRLTDGEKASTVRAAFNRVKRRSDLGEVNLFKLGQDFVIAARPQRRGRKPGA